MARVLICTKNDNLLAKCSTVLASDHCVEQASELASQCVADIIIVDTTLIDENSQLLSVIMNHPAHILLVGSRWPEDKQINALLHTAAGYYDEAEPAIMLQKAVENILQGDIWVQRHLVPKLIHALIENRKSVDDPAKPSKDTELLKTLSNREMDVADMISAGESNKQIASALNISERTVKAHLTSIFRKLNVSDRLHLALLLKEID